MPRAFDRRIPRDDHNPLRGLLDFTSVDSTVQDAGGAVNAQLELVRQFAEQLVRELLQNILDVALDPGQAVEELLGQLPDWVAQIPGLAQLVEWITGTTGDVTDLQTFLQDKWDGITESLTNFASILSGFGLGSVGAWITDLLGTKSTANTASSNATTSLGNWTSWLTGGSWANIAASVADFLGTKSTANTAGSNATTALGNFTSLISGAGESTLAAVASAIGSAKSNFSSLLSGMSVGSIGALVSDLLGTKSTANTADTNATTGLGNWTSALSGSGDANAGALGSSLATAKSNAAAAVGNFTTLFSNFSVANLAAWSADLLSTKSTASTASSNATTALGKFTTLLSNASEASEAALGAAFATAKSNASTAISNFSSLFSSLGVGSIGALGADLSGTKSTANTADTNATTAISGIGSIRDGLYNKLTGLTGSGWLQADTDQAVADTQATLASAVAAIQALQTQGTNNTNSGNAAIVNFALRANASSLGSDFTQTYSGAGTGVLGVTDGKGAWQPVNNSPRTCVAVYNALQSLSDYQIVGQAFSSAPALQIAGFNAQNTIIGRVNSAGTSYIFAEFEKNTVRLGCVVSGSRTVWTTLSSGFSFKAGQVYWLVCGTSGGARTYQVLEGSTPIITWTEVGTSSQMGASYRYTGLIVYAYSAGFTTILPGAFTGFAFADNTPSSTLGCGFRLFRGASGTNIGGGGTDVKVPNSYFDNVQAISPGITHTAGTNNQITINKAGWWIFNVRFHTSAAMGTGSVYQALLWKGTTVVARAEQHPGYISGDQWPALTGTFIIYCNVGDLIYAGMQSTTAKSYSGDAAGSETYFAGSWLGLT